MVEVVGRPVGRGPGAPGSRARARARARRRRCRSRRAPTGSGAPAAAVAEWSAGIPAATAAAKGGRDEPSGSERASGLAERVAGTVTVGGRGGGEGGDGPPQAARGAE